MSETFDWEQATHTSFFRPFYAAQGWAVEEDHVGKKHPWDVCVNFDGRPLRVDEKALRGVWPHMALEIVQDVASRSWGWLTETTIDRVAYAMWAVSDPATPEAVYWVDMPLLRAWFAENYARTKLMFTGKGWGLTVFALAFWTDLLKDNVARRLV